MREKVKREWKEFLILMRNIPSVTVVLFVLSVFSMNLLANKSISLPVSWLALDCGLLLSWIAFFTMDVITKHYGPKAATQISVLAVAINLLFVLIFFLASKIDGIWGEAQSAESNAALDNTFGGTWYVLLGSTVAFLASAVVNNFTNYGIGKLFKEKPDGIGAYLMRSYVSTAIGQFVDNLLFALIVSRLFFGWTTLQCVTCALTGMVAELLCEAAFSYFGFRICRRWKARGVGEEYFTFKRAVYEDTGHGNE